MTRVAPVVPAESDLLCEACGYTLNGLPESSNCPECGKPIQESIGSQRQVPKWERPGGQSLLNFFTISRTILFRPTYFYRKLATRRDIRYARHFAVIHWTLASMLFAAAAVTHLNWYVAYGSWMGITRHVGLLGFVAIFALTYVVLDGVTYLAARLTTWEATYRGLRLPVNVVLRGMYYHAAHYLPVALGTAVTVWGYQLMNLPIDTMTTYLYVLCAEVILFAGYLFNTYWIGMRNMMYANR